jgi:hypothetical protein
VHPQKTQLRFLSHSVRARRHQSPGGHDRLGRRRRVALEIDPDDSDRESSDSDEEEATGKGTPRGRVRGAIAPP